MSKMTLERNHSCYMPELEGRVKFEEAISAKRRGWHSPFRTICAAGFWKPMRQEREAFAPWRHSSASVGGTARRSVCSRCAAARRVVRRSGGMVLSADQFGFGNPGALLALQLERLHGGLLLEGDGEFAFDALAVDGAGVVGAEGVNLAVGGGIVDHATLDSFHVVII